MEEHESLESSDSSEFEVPIVCCIHVSQEEKGKVIPFTEKSWTKFVSCCFRWASIPHTEEGRAAEKCVERFALTRDATYGREACRAGYHRGCYQKFCHIGKLQRAEARKRKHEESEG